LKEHCHGSTISGAADRREYRQAVRAIKPPSDFGSAMIQNCIIAAIAMPHTNKMLKRAIA